MAVGQSGRPKVGVIIQVRYTSSRLPGKALKSLPIDSSVSILERIVNKMKKMSSIDEVIIATSDDKRDDIIEEFATNKQLNVFRGDLDNVLNRFVQCANKFDLDILIRKTGDNPISFVEVIDHSINQHIQNKNDYTRNIGLPMGTGIEIVNLSALKKIQSLTKENRYCEHVTLYINKHPHLFKRQEIQNVWKGAENMRLTIDYPSDYALFNLIFQILKLEQKEESYSINDIKELMIKNSWLLEINKNNDQKRQLKNKKEELEELEKIAKRLEYKNAALAIKDIINSTS